MDGTVVQACASRALSGDLDTLRTPGLGQACNTAGIQEQGALSSGRKERELPNIEGKVQCQVPHAGSSSEDDRLSGTEAPRTEASRSDIDSGTEPLSTAASAELKPVVDRSDTDSQAELAPSAPSAPDLLQHRPPPIHAPPPSPFEAAAQKHEPSRRHHSGKDAGRRASNKPAGPGLDTKRAASGPQPRVSMRSIATGARTFNNKGVHFKDRPPAAGKPDKGLPKAVSSSKLVPNLHKPSVLPKPASAALKGEKSKGAAGMKRIISVSELQPSQPLVPPERTAPAELKAQKSMPKSRQLLRKLTGSVSVVAAPGKAPLRLPTLAPMEKKILASVGTREWIRIDSKGEASVFKKDKHAMTQELGIQIRDLRLLDPMLATSYPSAILCRDKALVINLEYIKCIVTTTYMLVLDANLPAVMAFIQHLQQKLRESPQPEALLLARPSMGGSPFELKALEAALDEVCMHLESLAHEMEVSMWPIHKTPTASKMTSDYLERLRRLKSRMQRLKTRVETLKEVLDKYLNDETDMKAMHLTGRLREQYRAATRSLVRKSMREALQRTSMSADPSQPRTPNAADADMTSFYRKEAENEEEGEREVAEVEMLLQAYMINLDSTWNKLTDISEFVEDTEEFMDLEMDTYRNNVIKMKVALGAASFCAGTVWAMSNIFGMNLNNEEETSYPVFVMVSVITSAAAIMFMGLFTVVLHYRRLAMSTIAT